MDLQNPMFHTYDSDWTTEATPKERRGVMAVNAEAEAAKKATAVMNFMVSLFYYYEEMTALSAFLQCVENLATEIRVVSSIFPTSRRDWR
jgi:hypothetical protein